jgi:hypothetical protein
MAGASTSSASKAVDENSAPVVSSRGFPQAPLHPTPHQGCDAPGALHCMGSRREEPNSSAAPARSGVHARLVPGAPQDTQRGGEVSE